MSILLPDERVTPSMLTLLLPAGEPEPVPTIPEYPHVITYWAGLFTGMPAGRYR